MVHGASPSDDTYSLSNRAGKVVRGDTARATSPSAELREEEETVAFIQAALLSADAVVTRRVLYEVASLRDSDVDIEGRRWGKTARVEFGGPQACAVGLCTGGRRSAPAIHRERRLEGGSTG